MAPDRLARITAARHAPALGVALLALAACGQAAAQAVGLAAPCSPPRAWPSLYVLPLCLFALLSTVPLAVLGAARRRLRSRPATRLARRLRHRHRRRDRRAADRGLLARQPGRIPQPAHPRRRRSAQPLAIGLAVPFGVLALTSHGSVAAVLLAAGAPAAAAAGITVRARREARIRTAAGEALADTLTEHTARGERARIARELHDVVAHHISMIAVQAETARLTTPGLPAAGAQRFTEIGDTARAGLTEMRRLLGVLREDAEEAGATVADRHPQPGLPQLAELIDAARQASGSSARLIVSGPVAEFDPGVELAAYRIVQEALTNARRHAPGAAVDVELRYQDDALHLRIRDNGPGPARPRAAGRQPPRAAGWPAGAGTPGEMPGGGHGLPGMRERARRSAARCGPAPPRAAASSWRPTCRRNRRPHDRHRRGGRPRGRAGRVRGAARHPAGLRRARHRVRRRGGGGRLPRAAARRGPDGRADAGHRRHRGDQAAHGRRGPAPGADPDHLRPGRVRVRRAAGRRQRVPAQGRHRGAALRRGPGRRGRRRAARPGGNPPPDQRVRADPPPGGHRGQRGRRPPRSPR